ncbi:MAG: VWA domain-containing protein [candidate division WOR-3 bacterium]
MNWASPIYLNLLWLLPLFMMLLLYRKRRNKKLINALVLTKELRQVIWKEDLKNSLWREILLIVSFAFLVLSAARPRWGKKLYISRMEGYNIIFVLDASSSMLAQDVKGGRLNKAKEAIKTSITQLPGSRFGLVAFSGEAYKLCPLTTDVETFRLFVDLVEPSLIPTEGTDIGGGIRKAIELFPEKISGSKIIIVVTDGENTRGDPRVDALEARKRGIKVFTISAGTKEGAPIPKYDSTGKFIEYLKDDNGKIHISIVNQDLLKLIANAGGGEFLEGEGVELGLLTRLFRDLERGKFSSEKVETYEEKFIFFLIPSLLSLLLANFIKTGRE